MAESNHVDSYSVQHLASRGDPGDDDLLLGDRVLITKGKYSGKEGYLCSIGDDVVFVNEDVSGLQVGFVLSALIYFAHK